MSFLTYFVISSVVEKFSRHSERSDESSFFVGEIHEFPLQKQKNTPTTQKVAFSRCTLNIKRQKSTKFPSF